ncbi:unnamed protein product [Leuciscus chuanchicus]
MQRAKKAEIWSDLQSEAEVSGQRPQGQEQCLLDSEDVSAPPPKQIVPSAPTINFPTVTPVSFPTVTPNTSFPSVPTTTFYQRHHLYTGSISDQKLTKQSGILDLLEPGDACMADKGFTIEKMLAERGAKLIIPPFKTAAQFSKENA